MDMPEQYYMILDEIKQKYACPFPRFEIKGQVYEDITEIISWMEQCDSDGQWVMYSLVKDDLFELKNYFPRPNPINCRALAQELVNSCESEAPEKVYFQIRNTLFSRDPAIEQIYMFLREGMPYASVEHNIILDPRSDLKRTIYKVYFDYMEEHWLIKQGLLSFEYKRREDEVL